MPSLFDKLFFDNARHANSLPPYEKEATNAKSAGDFVTVFVRILKDPRITPNARINATANLMWDMVGSNMVPCAIHPNLEQVFFASEIRGGEKKALILVPVNFSERCRQDMIYNLGAMAFVGSQIKDYYNDKLVGHHLEVMARARATEAEFLLFVKKLGINYPFNDYQQKILETFPNGLDELWYDSKPFILGTALVKPPDPGNN